jgi:hypothetical protein
MLFIQSDLACLICGVATLSGAMLIIPLARLLAARVSGGFERPEPPLRRPGFRG